MSGYNLLSRQIVPGGLDTSSEVTLEGEIDLTETEERPVGGFGQVSTVYVEEFDEMDSFSRRQVFTCDGGPPLQYLEQEWAATEVELKMKHGAADLIDNDKFHLVVGLTGGGARERAGQLHLEMEKELTTENATAKKQHAASIVTYLMLVREWDDTAEGDREGERPTRPIAPKYETLCFTPLDRFWALMHKLYPARLTERMTEYLEFGKKPAKSLANMIQRLQGLKLVLNMPEMGTVYKFLEANPKGMQEQVKTHLTNKELDPLE
jgi:hypothetical protein